MNITSYKRLEHCKGWIEAITCREGVTTYKALEKSSDRMVVMKVIKKDKENAEFRTTLKELEALDSPYLVRYKKCSEDKNGFTV